LCCVVVMRLTDNVFCRLSEMTVVEANTVCIVEHTDAMSCVQ